MRRSIVDVVARVVSAPYQGRSRPYCPPSNPARATELACNYDDRFNACLRLDGRPYDGWDVHVGFDLELNQTTIQQLIDCGVTFDAALYGDDGNDSEDDLIRRLAAREPWPIVYEGMMGVEFYQIVGNIELDEDSGTGEDDELEVHITYYDCRTGMRSRVYRTGVLAGRFG